MKKKRKIIHNISLSEIKDREISSAAYSAMIGLPTLPIGVLQIIKDMDFNDPNLLVACAFCLTSAFRLDRILDILDFTQEIDTSNTYERYIKSKNYDVGIEITSMLINSGGFAYFASDPNLSFINRLILLGNALGSLLFILKDIYMKKSTIRTLETKKLAKELK